MKITKEQVQEYIQEHFDTFFVSALAQYVKEIMFKDTNEIERQDCRDELKQLIWEGISHGVKEYLSEYENESTKIIAKEFVEAFSNKKISIDIN